MVSKRIKTTDTVFDIVESVMRLEDPTITDIAGDLGYSPSTVHGHLKTLEDRGYVVKKGDGVFELALRFLTLGADARREVEGYDIVQPRIDRLVEQTNERAQFMTVENGFGVYVYVRGSTRAAASYANIGKIRHLNTCASGKAILADLPRDRVNEIIEQNGLERLTSNSITDREVLYEELEHIRERGYAINREESVEGLVAIGAAIHQADGSVLGSISLSAPAHRMTDEKIEDELSNKLLGTIEEIELETTFS